MHTQQKYFFGCRVRKLFIHLKHTLDIISCRLCFRCSCSSSCPAGVTLPQLLWESHRFIKQHFFFFFYSNHVVNCCLKATETKQLLFTLITGTLHHSGTCNLRNKHQSCLKSFFSPNTTWALIYHTSQPDGWG